MTRVIAGVARGRRLAVPPGRGTRPTSDRAREGLFATLTAIRGTLIGAAVLDLYAGSGAVGLEALSRGAARVLFVEADGRAARVIRENLKVVGLPGGTVVADRVARVLARGPAGPAGAAGAAGPAGPAGPAGAAGTAEVGRPAGTAEVGGPAGTAEVGGPAGTAEVGRTAGIAGTAEVGRTAGIAGTAGPGGAAGLAGEAGSAAGYDIVVADPPYAVGEAEVTQMLELLAAHGWLVPGAIVVVERATRSGTLAWPAGYAADRSRRYGEATFWYGLAAGIRSAGVS